MHEIYTDPEHTPICTRLGWMAGNLFSRASVEDWGLFAREGRNGGCLGKRAGQGNGWSRCWSSSGVSRPWRGYACAVSVSGPSSRGWPAWSWAMASHGGGRSARGD